MMMMYVEQHVTAAQRPSILNFYVLAIHTTNGTHAYMFLSWREKTGSVMVLKCCFLDGRDLFKNIKIYVTICWIER
jgi:hypothetical protein